MGLLKLAEIGGDDAIKAVAALERGNPQLSTNTFWGAEGLNPPNVRQLLSLEMVNAIFKMPLEMEGAGTPAKKVQVKDLGFPIFKAGYPIKRSLKPLKCRSQCFSRLLNAIATNSMPVICTDVLPPDKIEEHE